MKTNFKLILSVCLIAFLSTCKKDEEYVPGKWYANKADMETTSLIATIPRTEVNKKGVCCTEVKLYISATNQNGNPITGLNQYSFQVKQEYKGEVTDRNSFTLDTEESQIKQLALALTMDYSGSMSSADIQDMENAVVQFIQNKSSSDQLEIIKFSNNANKIIGFTTDKQQLINAVYATYSGGGATAFYDAIMIALNDGKNLLQNINNQTIVAIINFTDGMNNNSTSTSSDVIGTANSNSIPVYSIGFGNADEDSLQYLADGTGGRYYFTPSASQITQIYDLIKGQLANLYVIEFMISLPPDKNVTYEVGIIYESGTGILKTSAFKTIVTK